MRSLRITEHYAKCKSVPAKVKEWAVEKLGRSRSAVKRQGKEAVKKMQGMFDDIAKESDQAIITASLNKNIRATELCHEAVSHFIYDNLCSFNLTAVESRKIQQTRHCCSIVIGGGRDKRGKVFVVQ